MTSKTLLLILLTAIILETNMVANNKNKPQAGQMKPFATEVCEIKTKEDLFSKCVGKRVKIKGTIAKTVLHPKQTYPDISSVGGYINKAHIDTEWGQIALISQKTISCKEAIELEGILRITPLFDEENKEKHPYIQALSFNCK